MQELNYRELGVFPANLSKNVSFGIFCL